jgi:hypothetical protein
MGLLVRFCAKAIQMATPPTTLTDESDSTCCLRQQSNPTFEGSPAIEVSQPKVSQHIRCHGY